MIHTRMEKLYNEQNKTRVELQRKIFASKEILGAIKRKNSDGMIMEAIPNEFNAKGLPKMMPVDVAGLLDKLKSRIQEIHANEVTKSGNEGKEALTLLNVSFTFNFNSVLTLLSFRRKSSCW